MASECRGRATFILCFVGALGDYQRSTESTPPAFFTLPQVCTDPTSNETRIASSKIPIIPGNSSSKSEILPAFGIQFRWTPADLNRTWHNAPRRQLSVSTDAEMKVEVSGAPYERVWKIGEVHLEEDLTGKGHQSVNLDGPCVKHAENSPTEPLAPLGQESVSAVSAEDVPQTTTIYKVCNHPKTNKSHILPMNISLTASKGGAVSPVIAIRSVQWSWTSAHHNHSFHNAPARQFIANLDAPHKVTVSGAPYERVFQPGEVMFVEDVAGRGHCTANLGKARMTLFMPVDDTFDSGPCYDPEHATLPEAVVI